MDKKDADQAYLLSTDQTTRSSCDEELELQGLAASHRRRPNISWTAILIHSTIFLVYSILVTIIAVSSQKTCRKWDAAAYVPYSPEPQSQIFEHAHSIYVGAPSPELELAWSKLLRNSNIRITDAEISHIPDRKYNAIELPDGGYFSTLNAYHNLHCIKRLHHYMYEDYYFPNITQRQRDANEFHNHHCLDMLRQSVMCQGDMQLLTMRWRSDSHVPTANWTTPHRCVNWGQVEAWAGSRRIANLMEPGYLSHPYLGPAYPGGHGDPIGESLAPNTSS